jgi:hypothetical protein
MWIAKTYSNNYKVHFFVIVQPVVLAVGLKKCFNNTRKGTKLFTLHNNTC